MPISDSTRTSINWTSSTQKPPPVDGFQFEMANNVEDIYFTVFTPPRAGRLLIYAQAWGQRTAEDCGASLRIKLNGAELMRICDGSLPPPTDGTFEWEKGNNFENFNLRCSPAPDLFPQDLAFFDYPVKENYERKIEVRYWNKNATTNGFLIRIDYLPE